MSPLFLYLAFKILTLHYITNIVRSETARQKRLEDMKRTGIFVGTFDPFTIGHHSVVTRALPLFDRIVIGVGINGQKNCMLTAEERIGIIESLYAGEPKIEVCGYNELTVDFAHRVGADYIIKGVRSVKDFEYEREQADMNRVLGGVETILLYAEPQYSSISSSVVRELKRFGRDVSDYLPKPARGGVEEHKG